MENPFAVRSLDVAAASSTSTRTNGGLSRLGTRRLGRTLSRGGSAGTRTAVPHEHERREARAVDRPEAGEIDEHTHVCVERLDHLLAELAAGLVMEIPGDLHHGDVAVVELDVMNPATELARRRSNRGCRNRI